MAASPLTAVIPMRFASPMVTVALAPMSRRATRSAGASCSMLLGPLGADVAVARFQFDPGGRIVAWPAAAFGAGLLGVPRLLLAGLDGSIVSILAWHQSLRW